MRIRRGISGRATAIATVFGLSAGALLLPAPAMAASDTAGQCADTVAGAVGNSGHVDQSFTAPAGMIIFEVCVKAGSAETGGPYYFTSDTGGQVAPINGTVDPNCYTRSGLGTQTASVVNGSGTGCHDISHLVFYYQAAGTTQTSPTPTSSSGGTNGSNGAGTAAAGAAAPALPKAGSTPAGFGANRVLAAILAFSGLMVLAVAFLGRRRGANS